MLKKTDSLIPPPCRSLLPMTREAWFKNRDAEDRELFLEIEADGIQTPIMIHGNEIIDGLRRWTIAKILGLETVPVRPV